MAEMNWLDYLLALVVGASVLGGLMQGFARLGIGFAAAVFGLLSGIWFYGSAGGFLLPYVSSRSVANFIGFFLVLVSIVVLGGILGSLLARLFRWAGLSWLDRLLGGVFGLLRGMIFAIALVLAILSFSSKPPPRSIVESRIAPYMVEAASVCASMAPRELKDGFHESYAKVRQLWEEAVKRGMQSLPRREI